MKVTVTVKIEAYGGVASVQIERQERDVDYMDIWKATQRAEEQFSKAIKDHGKRHPDLQTELLLNAPLPAWLMADPSFKVVDHDTKQ